MNDSYLRVRRLPDEEEPYSTQLEIIASNGAFMGNTDFYCNVSDLTDIGRALQAFPVAIGNEYRYERGSGDPAARDYRHADLNQPKRERASRGHLPFLDRSRACLTQSFGRSVRHFWSAPAFRVHMDSKHPIAELYEHHQK